MNKSLTATLRYAPTSYQKMEIAAKLVRGKKVGDALALLHHVQKHATDLLEKVVHSALANAVHNAGQQQEKLRIKQVDIGRGMKIRRMRFVGRSRTHGYERKRAFVRVVLDVH